VSTQALGPVKVPEPQPAGLAIRSITEIQTRMKALSDLLEKVLVEGMNADYGKIPGTQKPTLLKAGSEKILTMFQIAVDPIVEDLSGEDCFRYRVTCRLTHAPTGEVLGSGVGECSTDETKYAWKRTYSKKEFNADPEKSRIRYYSFKGDHGWEEGEEMQIRQHPADMANTVLKMAKKRAQIDATLTVTGASSMFEQDLDEMDEETRQQTKEPQRRGRPRGKQSQAKSEDVICSECRATNGHLPSCKHHPSQQKPQEQPKQEAAKEDRMLLKIEGVQERTRKSNGSPFIIIKGVSQQNEEISLFSFHDETNKRIKVAQPVGALAIFRYHVDEKGYRLMDEVIELGGVPWKDNRPAPTVGAEKDGEW